MITDNKYYLEKIKQQQAEIDELRKKLDLINQYTAAQGEAIKICNGERLELRKRIDFIVKNLENIKNDQLRSHREDYDKGWRDCAITVLNDLKGTTNEQ